MHKPTLTEKRKVVIQFKQGRSFVYCGMELWNTLKFRADVSLDECVEMAQCIVRDFMNGRFTFEPKRRKR